MIALLKKIWFLSIVFIAISCKVLNTTAPEKKTIKKVPVLEASYIGLPIEISIKNIEDRINKELTGILYEDNSFDDNGGDNLKVKTWKKDNFRIAIKNNDLYYEIPIKLALSYRKFFELPEITSEITLKFKTNFAFANDWSLTTKTSALGYKWITEPVINVAGFEIKLTPVADIVIKKYRSLMEQEIDSAIKEIINLRSYAQEAWGMANKPISISPESNLWLCLKPEQIFLAPLITNGDKITIPVGIKSSNELLFSKEAPSYSESKFPDLTLVEKIEKGFSLYFRIALPFEKINDIANNEISGSTFGKGKKTIKITQLYIYPSNENIVIEVSLEGALKGNIYLEGKPEFNKEKNTIEFKNIQFTLDTKNKLLKAADWILHDSFLKIIEQKLVYNIDKNLTEAKISANNNIKNNTAIEGFLMNGNVNEIAINDFYITEEFLNITIKLIGELEIKITDISKF